MPAFGGNDGKRVEQPVDSRLRLSVVDRDIERRHGAGFGRGLLGTKDVSDRRCLFRIERGVEGAGDVIRGQWRAIRKLQPGAQMERDGAAAIGDFPRFGELGLKLVGDPIDAHQHASGEVADDFGGLLGDLERIECFGFRGKTEAKFRGSWSEQQPG